MNAKKLFTSLTLAAFIAPFMAFAAGVPETVTNVTATAIDSTSIGLSWDAAKDAEGLAVDHYRVYYGTTSIISAGAGTYDTEVDTPNNSTSFVVSGLTADTMYYFSVTAFSSDGLESEEYSWEGSASTPAEDAAPADPAPAGDTTAPTVVSVDTLNKTQVTVQFSEPITLPADAPESAFTIAEQLNADTLLAVTSATIDPADATGATVLLETAEQITDTNYIVTAGAAITDIAGNPIVSGNTDQGIFVGSSVDAPTPDTAPVAEPELISEPVVEETPVVEEDTTPPEDITSLILDFKEQVNTLFTILLNWTPSVNSAKDLADQIMYMSMDRGDTYSKGKSLGATVDSSEVADLEGGKEYTFKITTKDESGNESTGAIKSIRLPQTGVGAGILILTSLAGAGVTLRKKRKQI